MLDFCASCMTSCGSYQNSSYYDSDGIYGNAQRRNVDRKSQNDTNNQYKDYFSSLQNNNEHAEIFTDVDNYNDSIQNNTVKDN